MGIVVWGIPSCGTVKKACKALDAAGLRFAFRDLRSNPPSADELDAALAAFGARAMRNTSGASYRALPETKDTWSEAQWREAFLRDPMLLKRPLITREGAFVGVGFRDEAVLAKLR